MNAAAIARGLNARKVGGSWWARCPAHNDHNPSLKIDEERDGTVLVKCWAGCGQDAVIAALRSYGLWNGGPQSVCIDRPQRQGGENSPSSDSDRIARALALWSEATSPGGTMVEIYLTGRGLPLPAEAAGEAVRFHGACQFRLDDGGTVKLPTMLSLMRDVVSNEPRAVHRTALGPNGDGKARVPGLGNPKRMLGPTRGTAVKLTADADVLDGLGVAEGIETAVAVIAAGWHPVWACGSAGAVSTFPVLAGVEALTIFADADTAGLTAAQSCQSRWLAAKRECTIILPPDDGQDWADVREWRHEDRAP